MNRYSVSYIDGKKDIQTRTIDSLSHEDAYKQYLKIKGISNYPVKTFAFCDRTQCIWEDHKTWLQQSPDKDPAAREEKDQLAKADNEKSSSKIQETKTAAKVLAPSTDTLLKELIAKQTELIIEHKKSNETLKKIRWSLLSISLILILWHVFGL